MSRRLVPEAVEACSGGAATTPFTLIGGHQTTDAKAAPTAASLVACVDHCAKAADREDSIPEPSLQQSSQGDVKATEGARIACLACAADLSFPFAHVAEHPRLEVALCSSCSAAVEDAEDEDALDDEGGEEWCCLCASGGTLLCCEADGCGKGFCRLCVGRLFRDPFASSLTDAEVDAACEEAAAAAEEAEGWSCPACAPPALLEAAREDLRRWAASSGCGGAAGEDMDVEQGDAGAPSKECADEAEQQRLVDQLVAVEAEVDDALEALEDERCEEVAEEARAELQGRGLSGEALEDAVAMELRSYKLEWERRLGDLEGGQAALQELVERSGVDLFAVYKQLESEAARSGGCGAKTRAWASAPRVGQQGELSAEAKEAIESAEKQLALSNPAKVVNGEMRTKHRGASGFRKKPCVHQGGEGSGEGLSEEEVKRLYDAETPAQAAELGIKGVAEVDQIVDLDEEELAKMSEDEREMVEVALANEADQGCLTEAQASRVRLVDDAEDEEELEDERRFERQVAGVSRSGRKGVSRAPGKATGAAAPKARSRRTVTVRGKKRPEGAAEASAEASSEGGKEGGKEASAEASSEGGKEGGKEEAPLSAEVPAKRKRGRPSKEDARLLRENQNRGGLMDQTNISNTATTPAPTKSSSLFDYFKRQPPSKRKPKAEAEEEDDEVVIVGEDREAQQENKKENDSNGTRKKIMKVMSDKKLSKTTKEAQQAETERLKKLKAFEKQTKDAPIPEDPQGRLQLNGRVPGEQPVWLCQALSEKLKEHQVQGLRFMWDNLVQTLEDFSVDDVGTGAILAHSMGLGKTLQAVSFIHTLLKNKVLREARQNTAGLRPIKCALVLAPVNTLSNWHSELSKWLPISDAFHNVVNLETAAHNHKNRHAKLREWQRQGGVMIIGYEMFRSLTKTALDNKEKTHWKTQVAEALLDPGPDLVVADEAHVIKNFKSDISKQLKLIRTRRRLALTGSPLQNNLIEYHCMVDFVREHFLGTRLEFCNQYANPIANGQASDSTKADVRLMKRRAHVLHNKVQGFVQRRDATVLARDLLPKEETVLHVRLSPMQQKLYAAYMGRLQGREPGQLSGSLFAAFQAMLRVWNHPYILHAIELQREAQAKAEGGQSQSDSRPLSSAAERSSARTPASIGSGAGERDSATGELLLHPLMPEASAAAGTPFSAVKPLTEDKEIVAVEEEGDVCGGTPLPTPVGSEAPVPIEEEEPGANEDEDQEMELLDGGDGGVAAEEELEEAQGPDEAAAMALEAEEAPEDKGWWRQVLGGQIDALTPEASAADSGKVAILLSIVQEATNRGEKVLVFSQSVSTIRFLQDVFSVVLGWRIDREVFQIDGSKSSKRRQELVRSFNNERNTTVKVFLISTKAGALGINLVGANHCVLFDSSWNPATDSQAIFRIYRYGQKRPVHVYRLLAAGTMEEKIYRKQVVKGGLSASVVDDQQVGRHFSVSDVSDLLSYTPPPQQQQQQLKEEGKKPCVGDVKDEDEEGDDANMESCGSKQVDTNSNSNANNKSGAASEVRGSVLRAVLRAQEQQWVESWHQHAPLLTDKESEHLSAAEKALACWEDDREAVATRQVGSSEWQEYRLKSGKLTYYHLGRGLERSKPVDVAFASSGADTAEAVLDSSPSSEWRAEAMQGVGAAWVYFDFHEPTIFDGLMINIPTGRGLGPMGVIVKVQTSGGGGYLTVANLTCGEGLQRSDFSPSVGRNWRIEFVPSGGSGPVAVIQAELQKSRAVDQQQQAQGQPSLVPTGRAIPGWKEFIYMHPTSGRSLLYLDEQTHQWSKKTPPGWLALASSVAQQTASGQHALV